MSASDASRNATRLAFIGIDNPDWGSLDIGRNWGVLYDVTSLTDRSPSFGRCPITTSTTLCVAVALNLMTWRKEITLFQHPLKMALQYQFKGNNDYRTIKQQNGKWLWRFSDLVLHTRIKCAIFSFLFRNDLLPATECRLSEEHPHLRGRAKLQQQKTVSGNSDDSK
ncbi:porin [Klebsiella variicola subsp. variicola]|nr:porin [Klebsiella variicola subsp. variicola]